MFKPNLETHVRRVVDTASCRVKCKRLHACLRGRLAADEASSQNGRRPVRPETLAFKRMFLAAAAAAAGAKRQDVLAEGDQRTAAWLALRETRLTASAFGNALG